MIESVGHVLVLSELSSSGDGPMLKPQPQEPQQCPICLDALSDMVELSCKHRFCWKCFVLGPIAFQPGEYRITQCPICRRETSLPESGDGVAGIEFVGYPSSKGILTSFLHAYFPQDANNDAEDHAEDMREIIGSLIKAIMVDHWSL